MKLGNGRNRNPRIRFSVLDRLVPRTAHDKGKLGTGLLALYQISGSEYYVSGYELLDPLDRDTRQRMGDQQRYWNGTG
jgi:hypothetical protein